MRHLILALVAALCAATAHAQTNKVRYVQAINHKIIDQVVEVHMCKLALNATLLGDFDALDATNIVSAMIESTPLVGTNLGALGTIQTLPSGNKKLIVDSAALPLLKGSFVWSATKMKIRLKYAGDTQTGGYIRPINVDIAGNPKPEGATFCVIGVGSTSYLNQSLPYKGTANLKPLPHQRLVAKGALMTVPQ